jgi:L-fuconolactonase
MTRIDAHHHLWDIAIRDHPWMDGPWADPLRTAFTPAQLAPLAAGHGITATVAVQALGEIDETRELLATAAKFPLIAGVVGWVDLAAPDVGDAIAELRGMPGGSLLVGIRHQVQDEPNPQWLLRADVRHGLQAVGVAGLAYDLLVKPPQLAVAAEVAGLFPEIRFVVNHLAKPDISRQMWEPWASDLTALAAAPNITAKLSGLVTEADWQAWSADQIRPYVLHALDCFGPDRLMFGSDWPVCLLAAPYDQVIATAEALLGDLSDDEREAIFGGTARRVYRLRMPGHG